MNKKYILPFIFAICFSSCASIFNSAVLPNQCKKCEVINVKTGISLFTNEGCGGENTRLEENAQIEAYLLSRNSSNLCDLEVRCTTWRKNPEAEN
ncbi:MAG: hypothetical protein ACPGSL_02620 [Vicingaceae bacterium]